MSEKKRSNTAGAKAKRTKASKKQSNVEKAADALESAAQEFANAIVDQVGARIGELIDGAYRQYQNEMAELSIHREKLSRDLPDDFRQQYRDASQACCLLAFTLHYASEQSISVDNPVIGMLVLMYQQSFDSVVAIIGRYVAESSDCSVEQFASLIRFALSGADPQPYSASKAKVEEYMKGARTRSKNFIVAREILLEKHYAAEVKRIARSAELMPPQSQRRAKESKYTKASEDEARLIASGKFKLGSAKLIEHLCKKHVPDYSEMSDDEKKKARKRMREGLRELRAGKTRNRKSDTLKQR
jgi:hypothetical protein